MFQTSGQNRQQSVNQSHQSTQRAFTSYREAVASPRQSSIRLFIFTHTSAQQHSVSQSIPILERGVQRPDVFSAYVIASAHSHAISLEILLHIQYAMSATESVSASPAPPLKRGREPDSFDLPLKTPTSPNNSHSDAYREASPARSTTSSLSDAPSITTPTRNSVQNSAFAALGGHQPPPAKKPKLTFAEKEEERQQKLALKLIKDQQRAEERSKREAEKREKDADKARRDAEKEVERKQKEAERETKKAAKEAEKAAKEEERKRKADEKQRLEDEKKKELSKQKTLSSFFGAPKAAANPSTITSVGPTSGAAPSPGAVSTVADASEDKEGTPSKKSRKELSNYKKIFPDFFVKENTTLAPVTRFQRDDQASQYVSAQIDSYLTGNRSPERPRSIRAPDLFNIPAYKQGPRGRYIKSVREIIEENSGSATKTVDPTLESQNTQIRRTRDGLKSIPCKFLKFREDVRPPYIGTISGQDPAFLQRLARRPTKREIPTADYDNDSEAEWVEPEEGEDLLSGDEEEDDLEDKDDMDGFLDDEDDQKPILRASANGEMVPISSGLCWEDKHARGPDLHLYQYRMEVLHGNCFTSLLNLQD
jgi:chromatin assembly factor 1 subunit A